jgi:uncharacterized cupin superfamily protein
MGEHRCRVDDVPVSVLDREGFAHRRRPLARAAGGRKLGCSHMTVPAGRAAWPRHTHAANEEALYILQGQGTLRLGDETLTVSEGDYVALLPGTPHQLRNTSNADLTYLVLSTMEPVDITLYPDSNKLGLFAGAAPGGNRDERWLEGFHRLSPIEYWADEDGPQNSES